MLNFFKQRLESKGAMDKFRSSEKNLITYSELSEIQFGVKEPLYKDRPEAVLCTRVKPHVKGALTFHVEMKEGEVWHSHYHDCYETIIVHKGSIFDIVSQKTINRLQSFEILPGVEHHVKSLEYTEFYVQFNKN